MRKVRTVGIVVLLGLYTPGYSRAGFQWLEDWQVSPVSGPGSFGSAQADQATGSGSSAFTYRTDAAGRNSDVVSRIDFTRTFLLSGSPGGWVIDLEGTVSGSVGGLHAEGTLGLITAIVNQGQSVNLFAEDGGGGRTFPVNLSKGLAYSLADGVYTVSGTFTAGTVVPPPPFQGSLNLAGAAGGFTAGLTATPVPEAGSLVLLAIGAAGVAAAARSRACRSPSPAEGLRGSPLA